MELIGKMFNAFRVARDEKITHLERVPLFEDCSLRQLRAVADISTVVEVPERTVLTRAGEPGDEFFVIIDGTALVTLSPQKRHRMQPGAFFGEMSLLDGEPRSARSEEHTSELHSQSNLVCRLLLEKKKTALLPERRCCLFPAHPLAHSCL